MAARKEGMTPGDGKTSPFGNGAGAPQRSGSLTRPRDLVATPTGSAPPPTRPTSFAEKGKPDDDDVPPPPPPRDLSAPPPTDKSSGENPLSVPLAGKWPLANAGAAQRDAGTGSIGNPRRPFKGMK